MRLTPADEDELRRDFEEALRRLRWNEHTCATVFTDGVDGEVTHGVVLVRGAAESLEVKEAVDRILDRWDVSLAIGS